MKTKQINTSSFIFIFVFIFIIDLLHTELTSFADENTSLIFDFENDASYWRTSVNGSVCIDETRYNSGNMSLRSTERSHFFDGPAINLVEYLIPGESYQISAYIYHENVETLSYRGTIRFTNSSGASSYATAIQTDIPSNTWTKITGSFVAKEDSKESLLYFECTNETVDFWIDDFEITGLFFKTPDFSESSPATTSRAEDKTPDITTVSETETSPHAGDPVNIHKMPDIFDFENNTDLNFFSMDNAKFAIIDDYSSSGKNSLYIYNRKNTSSSLNMNVQHLNRNVIYSFSSYLMYYQSDAPEEATFRIYITYRYNGYNKHEKISEISFNKHTWSKTSGIFTIPEGAEKPSIKIYTECKRELENVAMNFFVDNITLTDVTESQKFKKFSDMISILIISVVLIILTIISRIVLRKHYEKKMIIEKASIDAMTGVKNRNAYESHIQKLTVSPELCKKVHIISCDLNFLKHLNDNLGHEYGDKAICKCANMLVSVVKNGDVYRIGGDEFICITNENFEESLRRTVETETKVEDDDVFSVAVGFSSYDQYTDGPAPSIKQIIERADANMYINKKECKERYPQLCRKKT